MDPTDAISALSSGDAVSILAVISVAAAIANVIQYRRNNALQDKLLDMTITMSKENQSLAKETNEVLSRLTEVVRESRR